MVTIISFIFFAFNCEYRLVPLYTANKNTKEARDASLFCFFILYSVASMTALIVCMRFSASSKTTDCGLENTSSETSMLSR